MDKQAYFEMCEMLGSEPIEEEIPIEMDDFPDLVQRTMLVYSYLADIWEGMSGTYMGKDLSILFNLFEIFEIERCEYSLALDIIGTIDNVRKKTYQDKKPKEPSKPKA